MSLHVII